jgi:hypothetical protein
MNRLLAPVALAVLALLLPLLGPTPPPAQAATTQETSGAQGADDCDEALHTRVSTVATAAPAPVGLGSCKGVRPGARIQIARPDLGRDARASCTMNFIYRGRDAQGRTTMYVGTAGHCAIPEADAAGGGVERAWLPGRGPIAWDGDGRAIGRVSYAILGGSRDFALVRLSPRVSYDPQMCHFGGPRGVNNERTNATVTLRHYGQGLGTSLVPARTSVARGTPDPDRVLAMGAVAPGDSGSGVLTPDGRAVGVVVTVGGHFAGSVLSPQTGTVGITRVGPQLARAGAVLKQTMRIVQAPLR